MTVDLFEARFRQELNKVATFSPNDKRDPRVWPKSGSDEGKFPAWRALFSSMCFFGHSTGYRLFSFDEFYRYCKHAYTERNPKRELFRRYFSGELEAGMRQRVGVWYESGMVETYLYACLIEAIEDKAKIGVVIYDSRVDWKLKTDMVAIINKHPMRISAYVGEQRARPSIERHRDNLERRSKRNTSESAHWHNAELESLPLFEIARTGDDMQVINGVRVFSLNAINELLGKLYAHAGVKGWTYPLPRC